MEDPALDQLFEFLRFPSISAQSCHKPDLANCAAWLVDKLRSAGLEARAVETPGHPVVLARTPTDPSKRTVLIYGHYDVQPPEPLDHWTSPPFQPTVRDDRIFARGSTDNKGQILAHILGVGQALREKDLPVNVIFLIEGEEEIGSECLPAFLEEHRNELLCDVIAISDTGMAADGYPTLSYALRGIATMEVIVQGPSHDLHSGVYGGAVVNPATVAARLIASLHGPDGRVAIPGFYDQVSPPEPWERTAAADCPLRDADIASQAGVEELDGETGFSAVERIGMRPTAEINGLGGGYQGEGSKTVLPATAFFKVSFRLVPHQSPDHILCLAERHFASHSPPGVRVTCVRGHGGEPYFHNPNTPDGLAARKALEIVFGKPPSLMREGGSIPILSAFQKSLGCDPLLLALASPDCRAHAPDENFPVANFLSGIRLNRELLRQLSLVKSAP